jgi:hypothetical protein
MDIVPIEIYGVSVDLPLPKPLSMRDPALEEFVQALCDPQIGIGLRPSQVQLINRDWLYQYELTATFFEGNGTLVRNPERLRFSVRNARNWADWQLVHQTMLRVHNLLVLDPKSISNLTMQAQLRFPSMPDRERFLKALAPGRAIARPCGLGYLRIPDWESEVRVQIEDSNLVPNGVYIGVDTQYQNNQDWESFVGCMPTMFAAAANAYGIGFEPFAGSPAGQES